MKHSIVFLRRLKKHLPPNPHILLQNSSYSADVRLVRRVHMAHLWQVVRRLPIITHFIHSLNFPSNL